MKFKKLHYISTLLIAAIAFLTMMSNSAGITGQSTIGCSNGSGCHNTVASASTVISITGLPTTYVNGTTYNLTLTVTNVTQTAANARAGFDLTVNSGTLAATNINTALNGTTELRHTAPKVLSFGTTSWTLNWTAPATGTANAVFQVACNATNGNAVNDAGDLWNTATINVPGPAVTVPTVTVGTPSGITSTTATINGGVTANNAATTVTVEYGTTIAYGQSAAATPGTVTGSTATPVTAALSGLAVGTLYHYRIKAVNSAGTTNSPDATFTTLALAPVITVGTPSSITNSTATINGTVNANNAATSSLAVEYGLTTSYGSTAAVTPASVSGNTATNITSGLTGLAAATTYHYRIVAVNSVGTTQSPDATFTTLAAVTLPTITVGAPTAITFNSATLNGTVNANGGSTTVSIEYGLTTTYGQAAVVTPATVTGITPTTISSALSGLAAATTYHYRVVATNSAGTTTGTDNTFTTAVAPTAPTITVTAPTGITMVSAVVHGTVNANNATATVTVEYGTTIAYGQTAAVTPSTVTGNTATAVAAAISGLLPLTTYHYRIVAANSVGTTSSPDNTFTTLTNVSGPTVTVGAVTGITTTTGTINGTVNANNGATAVTIQYGLTTAYGNTVNATPATVTGATPTAVSAALSGLAPGTTYHYIISAVNSAGTANSADFTFTTTGLPGLPIIVLGTPNSITSSSANVTATVTATNAPTTVSVEYGLTPAYGATINTTPIVVNGNSPINVTAALSLLSPLTTYHYRVKAMNSAGTVTSADATFTTISQFVLPAIVLGTPSNMSYNRGVVNATVNANNFNTSVSVEYGLTTSYGSTINATPGQVFGTSPTAVSATIGQLQPNTTYHYRFAATNTAGTVYSADDVITTTSNPAAVSSIEAAGFHLFPNPGRDVMTLMTKDNAPVTITGTSLDGRAISLPNRMVGNGQYQIDITQLPAGMYLMILKSGGESFTTRFSKL